jgi:adenine-specific DNA-methyltransferase
MDIVADNIRRLKKLFPETVTEGKVDFDALKEVLGNYIDGREERYSFTWNGKSKARMLAQTPSTGTLRPCKEESVDWNNTQNLFIEGDNLEVLKLLQKSYHKKVKMIYIDPPYNTGKDFVYKDNFKDNIKNYKEITGQIDGEGRNLSSNPETSGRYHTDWLNMMYPRLKLARSLLRDDGVIVVSIDENENSNLIKLLEEIFGEENFCGEIVWKNTSKNDQKYISVQHEYFIVFTKNKSVNGGDWIEKKDGLEEIYKAFDGFYKEFGNNWLAIHEAALEWYKSFPDSNPIRDNKHYSWMDERGVYFASDASGPNVGQYVYDIDHPVTGKPVKRPARGWFCPKENLLKLIDENRVHFGEDENKVPCLKTYLKDTENKSLTSLRYKDGRAASKRLRSLFGEAVFTNPKDEELLKDLFLALGVKGNDIVLDFFAGSASTMHAVTLLNLEYGFRCRTTLVQLPEDLRVLERSSAGTAKKACSNAIKYLEKKGLSPNICEIGKERFRLVGMAIKGSKPDYQGDLGFKVFKLDSTNIKPWELDFDLTEQDLEDQISNIKHGRKEEDVLYEVLLKYGLDLTLPITEHIVAGHKVFDIGMGALMICLSNDITLDVVEGIATLKDELKPEIMRVVFKDAGFADDVVKTNAVQILKQAGIEDVRSL